MDGAALRNAMERAWRQCHFTMLGWACDKRRKWPKARARGCLIVALKADHASGRNLGFIIEGQLEPTIETTTYPLNEGGLVLFQKPFDQRLSKSQFRDDPHPLGEHATGALTRPLLNKRKELVWHPTATVASREFSD
jgi:hypothetical protein